MELKHYPIEKLKKEILAIIILVVVGLVFALTVVYYPRFKGKIVTQGKNQSCVTRTETRTVRGQSLAGVIEEGKEVAILVGYYACNEAKRGEIVVYRYGGSADPIIKIIKGLAGDRFGLGKKGTDRWITINGEVLRNAQGKVYQLDEQAYRLLSLYVRDYEGVIPANAFLILGNTPGGSLDSTRFGLVDKSDFVGKVVE